MVFHALMFARSRGREMVKTEAVGRGFQHLSIDLTDVDVLEKNI